jgi:very-short-patch-repair endonuclease
MPEVSVPRGGRYRPAGIRVHESTDLHLAPPVPVRGIPTTSVDRTIVDLGAVVPVGRVHLAVDDARRRGLSDWDPLLTTLVNHARRGRRGVGALRQILGDHYGEVRKTDSGFERLVVTLLVQAGLPRPVVQHWITIGGRSYRIDLAYPEHRLAIELDGGDHLRREQWEADHARQNAVVLTARTILRYTWRDYTLEPTRIVTEVRRALQQAADR